MKFVSIDIETTDLKPENGLILEFAAVFVDKGEVIGQFQTLIKHKQIVGDIVALTMNAQILREIREKGGLTIFELTDKFREALATFGFAEPLTVAGKNFAGFDGPWLASHCPLFPRWRHRVLDVGSMYVRSTDEYPPDLAECCRRAGVPDQVTHRAIDDALCVASCVVRYLHDQNS